MLLWKELRNKKYVEEKYLINLAAYLLSDRKDIEESSDAIELTKDKILTDTARVNLRSYLEISDLEKTQSEILSNLIQNVIILYISLQIFNLALKPRSDQNLSAWHSYT